MSLRLPPHANADTEFIHYRLNLWKPDPIWKNALKYWIEFCMFKIQSLLMVFVNSSFSFFTFFTYFILRPILSLFPWFLSSHLSCSAFAVSAARLIVFIRNLSMNTLQIQIQIHKYTNTQIQICSWLFSSAINLWTLYRYKYTNTNTQIYKYRWYKYVGDCFHP